jgi:hypothetical protein
MAANAYKRAVDDMEASVTQNVVSFESEIATLTDYIESTIH